MQVNKSLEEVRLARAGVGELEREQVLVGKVGAGKEERVRGEAAAAGCE
jgi:hypothetical protein